MKNVGSRLPTSMMMVWKADGNSIQHAIGLWACFIGQDLTIAENLHLTYGRPLFLNLVLPIYAVLKKITTTILLRGGNKNLLCTLLPIGIIQNKVKKKTSPFSATANKSNSCSTENSKAKERWRKMDILNGTYHILRVLCKHTDTMPTEKLLPKLSFQRLTFL